MGQKLLALHCCDWLQPRSGEATLRSARFTGVWRGGSASRKLSRLPLVRLPSFSTMPCGLGWCIAIQAPRPMMIAIVAASSRISNAALGRWAMSSHPWLWEGVFLRKRPRISPGMQSEMRVHCPASLAVFGADDVPSLTNVPVSPEAAMFLHSLIR